MNVLAYSIRQLLRYHAYCKANPLAWVLPPGGRKDWDDMRADYWLAWFRECLQDKINRGAEPRGKGNRSRRRIEGLADQKAVCKWCGTKTGNRNRLFCDASCFRSYG